MGPLWSLRPRGHCLPFMTHNKRNSDRHHVIVDLSWLHDASLNSCIDKTSNLDGEFALQFPTVDDITSELKRCGRAVHLCKVDVSHAFCHFRADAGDYDLLGLQWKGHYINTCILSRKSNLRLSDRLRFIMCNKGFTIIDYIDMITLALSSQVSSTYLI